MNDIPHIPDHPSWTLEEWKAIKEKLETLSAVELALIAAETGIVFTSMHFATSEEQLLLVLDESEKDSVIRSYENLMEARTDEPQTEFHLVFATALRVLMSEENGRALSRLLMYLSNFIPSPSTLNTLFIDLALRAKPAEQEEVTCLTLEEIEKQFIEYLQKKNSC